MTRATAAAMATRLESTAKAPSGITPDHSGSDASVAARAAEAAASRMLHSRAACLASGMSFMSGAYVEEPHQGVTDERAHAAEDDQGRGADGCPPPLEVLVALLASRRTHCMGDLDITQAGGMLIEPGVVGLELAPVTVLALLHAGEAVQHLIQLAVHPVELSAAAGVDLSHCQAALLGRQPGGPCAGEFAGFTPL